MKYYQILLIASLSIFLSGCMTPPSDPPKHQLYRPQQTLTKQASNQSQSSPLLKMSSLHSEDELKEEPLKKNPIAVNIYPKHSHPDKPYMVVGEETVSQYNHGGVKRAEAYVRDKLRRLAAYLGGDAVIDIKHDKHMVSGTVVSFNKSTG